MNEAEMAAGLAATPGYRYASRVGDRLHVAGQVPLDSDGVLVGEGDAAAQARQCLGNLGRVVDVHGFSMSDVRHLRIYVVGEHRSLLDAWDAVRSHFDGGGVPPATLLGVHLLGYPNQLVEIDAEIAR